MRTNRKPTAYLLMTTGLATALAVSACSAESDEVQPAAEAEIAVAPDALVTDGKLTLCSALSMAVPPNYMYDQDNTPAGMEIELAEDWAARMGLRAEYVDVAFSSLIPTLQAGQCDAIVSSLYLKPEREEIVDFVPYMWQGQGIAVLADNPKNITGHDESLCDNSVATTIGTTAELNMDAMTTRCEEKGRSLDVVKFDNATSAAQSVMSGQQDALAAETPVLAYRASQTNGQLVQAGEPYGLIKVGAAVSKDNAELRTALAAALESQTADGTYEQLLDEYGQADMNISNEY